MKKAYCILICFICLLVGCKKQATNESAEPHKTQLDIEIEAQIQKPKDLYKELFQIMDLNDSGTLSDEQFKPKADSLKAAIDSAMTHLTSEEKKEVYAYGNKLLKELTQKKVERDN